MKRLCIVAALALIPHIHYAMEFTKEEAGDLYWESGPAYDQGNLDYESYKANMMRAIPVVEGKQHHYHNPLISAVYKGDYEFTQFLLKQGLSPIFRGMNQMDAFDALRIKNGGVMKAEKPFEVYKQFVDLLMSYFKQDDKHTTYPLASANGIYLRDREFKNFIDKKVYATDSQFKEFIISDLNPNIVKELEEDIVEYVGQRILEKVG